MRHDKVVKDKRITLEGDGTFLATVEYFKDTPARDGDEPLEKPFATMDAAQKWLTKFPRDAWLGYEITEIIQRELDKGKRNVRFNTRPERQGIATVQGGVRQHPVYTEAIVDFGRQLVRSMPRSR